MFTQWISRGKSGKAILSVLLISGIAACGGGQSGGEPENPQQAASSEANRHTVAEQTPELVEGKALWQDTYSRPTEYPKIHSADMQYIPTSSGHRIALKVTLPAHEDGSPAAGPFPVILVQSGYNIGLTSMITAPGGILGGAPDPFMIKRGYAMVSADVIGGGMSEGGWELFGETEQAGYGDVVDWIQTQSWADGNIGVTGASYMAISSLFTAQQRPDDIKAIFASVPMGDPQRGTVGTGGLINGVFMSLWMTATHLLSTQNIPNIVRFPHLMEPIMASTRQHVDQIDNFYLPLIDKTFNGHPDIAYDGHFWRTRSPLTNIDQIKAPTFIMGSLDDVFQRDAPLLYEALKDKVDTRLMIFGGTHVTNFLQSFTGTTKTAPLMHLMLQWFDRHLKGMATGTERIPPVTQYVKHREFGLWQGFATATDWPHPQAVTDRWYLHGDGTLNRMMSFDDEPSHSMETPEFAEYHYGKSDDGGLLNLHIAPSDGTECSPSYVQWTLGAAAFLPPKKCHWDNTELEQDALNYETEPMAEDYYINGPIQADLWISSTHTDAVLSVRVNEVTAKGRVAQLSSGLLLASMGAVDEQKSRYLDGEMVQPYHFLTQEKEQLLVPGEVTKVSVEIFPTSALIRKGSRLRISISPSNQAQGVLNLTQRERVKDSVTTIHNSMAYPSSVVMLKVPVSELN